jgi:hypothetical protein
MRAIISGIVAKAVNDAMSQQFPTFPWMISAVFLVKTCSILWGRCLPEDARSGKNVFWRLSKIF